MVASISAGSKGFSWYSKAPRFVASIAVPMVPWPVIMITGSRGWSR